MNARLRRERAGMPPSELEYLARLGFLFEQGEQGLTVIYPEGAVRQTVDAREGRYAVFFTSGYQRRKVKEVYSPASRVYLVMLTPDPVSPQEEREHRHEVALSQCLSREQVCQLSESVEALSELGVRVEAEGQHRRVIYPEGAVRETISEAEGRYVVFFTSLYERRQMSEQYDPQLGGYALTLKPARFGH